MGLFGIIPLGFGDDRVGALFALRPLDDHDVVLEIDGQRRIRRQDQVDAIRELLRRGGRRLRRTRGIALDVGGRVGLHVRDGEIERRIAALLLHNRGGKLHAAKILITAVVDLNERVAEHRSIDPGLDAIEHVLLRRYSR